MPDRSCSSLCSRFIKLVPEVNWDSVKQYGQNKSDKQKLANCAASCNSEDSVAGCMVRKEAPLSGEEYEGENRTQKSRFDDIPYEAVHLLEVLLS